MNAVSLEPLFGQTIASEGHTYAFTWDGFSIDGGPPRNYLNTDVREVVTILRGAMAAGEMDGESERAVALAASALGLSPFEDVPIRGEIAPEIGSSGALTRANAQMVRETREVYDRMSQALGLEIDQAEARGSTLLVRAELPPELLVRLAGGRVAAFIGRGYDSWAVITPVVNHGDIASVAQSLEEEARHGRLEAITAHPGPSESLVDRTTVSPASALAYAAFLAPEVMMQRLLQEPQLREALRGEISVPSALVADSADHTIAQVEQRERLQERPRERDVERDR